MDLEAKIEALKQVGAEALVDQTLNKIIQSELYPLMQVQENLRLGHWSTFINSRFCLLTLLIYIFILASAMVTDAQVIPSNDLPDFTPGELLIRVTPQAQSELEVLHAKAPLQKFHDQMGVRSVYRVFPHVAHPEANPNLERIYLLRFQTTADLYTLRAAYAAHPLIEAVDLNYIRPAQASEIIPDDPRYEEQWNLPIINMPQAWAIEQGDANVIMAIVDTGFDYTHEDLAPKTWINTGEIPDNGIDDDNNGYVDDVRGWDFVDAPNTAGEGDFHDGDNDPMDESGHGTHVAGIAGAAVDNGIGVAGVAWNCPLMAVRGGASGRGGGFQDDDSTAAIVYAVDNGAKVINMSWGSTRNSFVLRDAINYAYARGVLLVAAAGNESASQAIFPAAYRKVMAVASTQQREQRFYQSNFGASIDIGAPGNVILSTQINNRYRLLSGTSMATPHVVGVAALIMSKRPGLTHDEVRQILVSTTEPITESPELVDAGNLNAVRALMASGILQARISSPESNEGGLNEIEIIGTAGGFKFSTWQLQYGESTTPTMWLPINTPSRQQKTNERLLIWETSTIPEGIYSIRLEVVGGDGNVVRDEVVVFVDRTPPQVRNVKARQQISRDNFITVATWSTDDFTINTLSQRAREGLAPFTPIEETAASTEHSFSLPVRAGDYDFFITSRNAAGLETVDDNGGRFYRAEVIDASISPNGFVETSTGLPPMHLGSVTADFDRDGLLEIVGLPLTEEPASGIEIYERSAAGTYQLVHTGDLAFKPWAVDDTDGDGLLEILGSTAERTFLIESITRNGYPERIIWESPALRSGQIADIDGDGRKEIIGPDNFNGVIRIFENRGNDAYELVITLDNETEGANAFGEQVAIGDFDGDGDMELMTGDSEGELLIYESTGDDLMVETWRERIDAENAYQLAAGDLTGDGIPDFVVGGTVSEPDLPSLRPRRKYTVFTATGDNRYTALWSQEIVPFRLEGNSLAIGDVDGDSQNELVILANPSVYVFKGETGGPDFTPIWHHDAEETPRLILADLNQDGFREIYLNDQANLFTFAHDRASNPNSVVSLQPWRVSATPFNERLVRLAWEAPSGAVSFTVYRTEGQRAHPEVTSTSTPPQPSEFSVIADELDAPGFFDRNVRKDITYWYAVTAKGDAGIETDRTEAVSVTPRTPPKLLAAEFIQSNQVAVIFDKRMGFSIANEKRYLLREPEQLVGVSPASAIRIRMGRQAVLTFQAGALVPGRTYEITVTNVRDIDRNPIDLRASTQPFDVPPETDFSALKDFTQVVVYPNPVRPNEFHKRAVTFDRLPIGATVEIYDPTGDLIEELTVTESDRGRKEWLLLSNGGAEVTSGVYIYAMEFENLKKIGKIAVIK
ncbi:MAG: S8 family serine peptidase [Candidatus Poribacteria bacterium]|nr:S8 family serine peptidase [Candidatus Poribacteria bacterium]